MSLQAYQLHGVRWVRIVPIGLRFERKDAVALERVAAEGYCQQ